MSNSSLPKNNPSDSPKERANYMYYFEVGIGGQNGKGEWKGHFYFKVTDWEKFWHDPIGFKNHFLTIGMFIIMRLFGKGRIYSKLLGFPDQGDAGVVTNLVHITKFGLTLYLLREEYILNPDGRQVHVRSSERFGPIPFLFDSAKEHPAEILDSGMLSVYYMPLLGTNWIARYTVREDRNHIDSLMTCHWGEAEEVIDRVR